jgi:Domain of unknown function (DUF4326)
MTIEVVHCKKCQRPFEYIGRPCQGFKGSLLANPFHLKTEADRPQVILTFRQYLWVHIQQQSDVYDELVRLKDRYIQEGVLRLGCWCAPKACHGDVVRSAILWLLK